MTKPVASQRHIRQAGFTIVELMIATLVFTMVLLVITYGVIHFTQSYYRGVNSSTTQTTGQNIIDMITRAIQFSDGGTTVADDTHFCAGNRMFLYNVGTEFTGTMAAGNRGLYMVPATATCADPGGVPSGGTQLLGRNMRLAALAVGKANDADLPDPTIPWSISVRVAYGDSDLLCSPAIADATDKGSCSPTNGTYTANAPFAADDMECKVEIGSQFCSVAVFTTAAQQRIIVN